MKKKNANTLKLNKKSISNLRDIAGGRPPNSFYRSECDCVPVEKVSRFIESNCIGCTVTTVSG